MGTRRISRDEQIRRMSEKHRGFYTYENWGWPTSHEKSWITCPIHGDFKQSYTEHFHLFNGCPSCGNETISRKLKVRWEDPDYQQYKSQSQSRYLKDRWANDKEYRNLMIQATNNHPYSLGVGYIAQFLKYHNIEYQGGDDLANEFVIPGTAYRFDFYLPDYNLFIEFHGSQHYKGWGGKESNLEKKQANDQWKKDWVDRQPGLNLLVIPYWDIENIEPLLSEALGL